MTPHWYVIVDLDERVHLYVIDISFYGIGQLCDIHLDYKLTVVMV